MSSHDIAHFTLEYLITKATIDGEHRNAVVRIPYWELAKAVGKIISREDYDTVDLVVKMDLSWDQGDGGETKVELDDEDIGGFEG